MANSKCRWQRPEDWAEWSQWLAAGLHARNRWRLPVLLVGILFAQGRRTVTTWLRAAGVSHDLPRLLLLPGGTGRQEQIRRHPIAAVGPSDLAAAGSAAGGYRRHAHQALRPAGRRGRHPSQTHAGPADQKYLYGHIWVTLSLAVRHPRFGPLALPLRAMLYVRRKRWPRFRNGGVGRLPPSSCWPPGWSNGSLRSSNKPGKRWGSSSMAAT